MATSHRLGFERPGHNLGKPGGNGGSNMTETTPKNYNVLHEGFHWDLPETFNFGSDVVDIWLYNQTDPR